jgi:peptidoglycan hydrolase CwlO-like protein
MNKANNTNNRASKLLLLLNHPLSVSVATTTAVIITAFSALVLIAIVVGKLAQSSYSPQPATTHHQHIYNELQRMSAQLDRTETHHHSVGERLEKVQAVLFEKEAMASGSNDDVNFFEKCA